MEFLKCPVMSCLISCGWSMLNLEGWLASCSVPNNDKENAQNSHQNTFFLPNASVNASGLLHTS